MILEPWEQTAEKWVFLQKHALSLQRNALPCKKKRCPAENCGFWNRGILQEGFRAQEACEHYPDNPYPPNLGGGVFTPQILAAGIQKYNKTSVIFYNPPPKFGGGGQEGFRAQESCEH